ncbi:PA2169 family four-helix-bundle protein [Aquabacterium sp.]|uniref:PA2169 family four-helix-bundle protein n=1 Tax=Aquabacterium sp. TaxID=1872578 RepID=UPI002D072674|nr:PA2169 family four-helix-bundle protein [Aquabacterium sp.]HSW04816.1 PA2169 family four-helix-bundle protein [Aquabacterium sp.]
MSAPELLPLLNALTSLCFDGEAAFAYGVQRASSTGLRQLFLRRAQDCRAAAHSLQRLVLQQGALPQHGGSAAGDICLSFVAVRCALCIDADRVLLDACEQGDALALRWYRAVLMLPLPTTVRVLVAAQHDAIENDRLSLMVMRERLGSWA